MKKLVLCLLVAVPGAHANVLFNEPFSYSDGDLTTVSSGAWTAFSGAGNLPVQDVGGIISLTNVPSGASGEDLSRSLNQTYTSGSLYASLLVSQTVAPTTANGAYFASFYSSASSGGGYESRIFASATATGWTFGLNPSGTAPVDWGADLSLGTYYQIVLKFDLDTKAVNMGVFDVGLPPSSDTQLTLTGTSTQTAGPDNFALRQAGGDAFSLNINSIIVGTTLSDVTVVPEPSSLVLLGGGLAMLALRFRNRRKV